jgi:membrane-associated phospholipid phosphatase
MVVSPTGPDLWLARESAGLLRVSIPFDNAVDGAIHQDILGGFWFGAALFVCWIQSARKCQTEVQTRIMTILSGTVIVILLTLVAGVAFSWPPPCNNPDLEKLFAGYFEQNPNINSFPSQSTALYAVVAAGVYSIKKVWGWVLWIMVALFVALPRMYVGGHYLTDVFSGLILAVLGYAIARYLLEPHLILKAQAFFEQTLALQNLREFLIFVWIFQVAVEFRQVVWIMSVLGSTL